MMRSHKPMADAAGALPRTRLRGKSKATVLSAVVSSSAELRNRPTTALSTTDWQQRLVRVAEVWGDGWVLRQGVAALPEGIDLDRIASVTRAMHSELHAALAM